MSYKPVVSYSVECCGEHINCTQPDSLGKIFCYLNCYNCDDKNFCLKIKRAVEEYENTKQEVKDLIKKGGER